MNRSPKFPRLGASSAATILATLMGMASAAHAQTLTNVSVASQGAKAGDAVAVKIELRAQEGPSWCGLLLDLGNGTRRELRIGDKGPDDLSQTISVVYPHAGTYRLTVSGAAVVRGLKSAPACRGNAVSHEVKILDPEVAAARSEASAAARELDEREQALRQREKALQERERSQGATKGATSKKAPSAP